MTAAIAVRHCTERLTPDRSRVITRLFVPGQEGFDHQDSRTSAVVARVLALDDEESDAALQHVISSFQGRHPDLLETFAAHAAVVADRLDPDRELPESRRLLIGATFTSEYAVEGAALCNPSVVPHPDQSGVPAASLRFVMSVRAVGEGHRSSIGFRVGTIDGTGDVTLEPAPRFAVAGQPRPVELETSTFRSELNRPDRATGDRTYGVEFDLGTALAERVLWPSMSAESHGMEDARFVRFTDDDGDASYYATYTAYDGADINQQLLETTDFGSFTSSPLVGDAAANKGLALFPRKIAGRFAALSRWDRESNSVAFSDNLRQWPSASPVQLPTRAWELLQLGNCGSPIETEAGWLVLTHGVGPMRTYSIGALLLDLDDPTVVVSRLREPLVAPGPEDQDGYVPNVVYSCGALVHADNLLLPYGIGDAAIGIATVSMLDLLAALDRSRER